MQFRNLMWRAAPIIVALLTIGSSADAATMFSYTGNDFTECSNQPDCTNYSLSLWFTVAATNVENYSLLSLTPFVTDYSVTDEYGTFGPDTIGASFQVDLFSTDGSGDPASWNVTLQYGGDGTLGGSADTIYLSPNQAGDSDISCDNGFCNQWQQGTNFKDPGTWTVTRNVGAVPEPSMWMMMLAGFGLIGAALRYQRTAARRDFGVKAYRSSNVSTLSFAGARCGHGSPEVCISAHGAVE